MSFLERMLNETSGSESEGARVKREKDATEVTKARTEAEEAERLLKSLAAAASKLPEEEIRAGLEKARKGLEKKDQYPDRPSDTLDKKAA